MAIFFLLQKFPWNPEPVEIFDEVSGPKVNDEACLIYIPAGGNRLCYNSPPPPPPPPPPQSV